MQIFLLEIRDNLTQKYSKKIMTTCMCCVIYSQQIEVYPETGQSQHITRLSGPKDRDTTPWQIYKISYLSVHI